jgi:hypothetical protein
MNFNELPEKDQRDFAEKLVNKINDESIISSEVNFKVDDVESDEMTGDLNIYASHEDLLSVERLASWTVGDEDEVNYPEDEEYQNPLEDDVREALDKTSVEIDGYLVTVIVDEVEEFETENVNASSWSNEDAGIGAYEYFGSKGYDSRPYIEVEGSITQRCNAYLTFEVAPAEKNQTDESK